MIKQQYSSCCLSDLIAVLIMGAATFSSALALVLTCYPLLGLPYHTYVVFFFLVSKHCVLLIPSGTHYWMKS
jgi:hypothetical protein